MGTTDFYNCSTIYIGKYIDSDSPKGEIEDAKALAQAFSLWADLESYDEVSKWLIIKISYVNDIFYTSELMAAIKAYMQINGFHYIKSFNEQKPI